MPLELCLTTLYVLAPYKGKFETINIKNYLNEELCNSD